MVNILKQFPLLVLQLLQKYAFIVKEEFYNEAVFGNACIVVENRNFALRIVKDRSQIFIEIRSLNEKSWHQLIRIFEYLNIPVGDPLDTVYQIKEFERNYRKFCELFENNDKQSEFNSFEQEKNQATLDNIFLKKKDSCQRGSLD